MFRVTLTVLRFSHREDLGDGQSRDIFEPDQVDVIECHSMAEAQLAVQSWREMVLAASGMGARRKLRHEIEEVADAAR